MTMTAANEQQSTTTTTNEEILVLYGSQTGNSEAAAQEITSLLPTSILHDPTTNSPCTVTARCMHLDDFLEFEHAKWTRLVIIVCSSYGVGQAPIGARKFRDVCDAILEQRQHGNTNNGSDQFLKGVSFALLGLGDSHYSTFFQNPTTIHEALVAVGATRVGELGKADASGTGDMEQCNVIERWMDAIWDDLSKVINAQGDPQGKVLEKACEETWGLCLELFPEWRKSTVANYYSALVVALCVSLGGVMVSILVNHFFPKNGGWSQ